MSLEVHGDELERFVQKFWFIQKKKHH